MDRQTKQEILDEVDVLVGSATLVIRDTDLTLQDLRDRWHCAEITARKRGAKLVEKHGYVRLLVFNPKIRRYMTVWRKAEQSVEETPHE